MTVAAPGVDDFAVALSHYLQSAGVVVGILERYCRSERIPLTAERPAKLRAAALVVARHFAAPAAMAVAEPRSDEELSPAEAAARLGVDERTVRRWCLHEELPARKRGSRWLISAAAVDEWLEERSA